MTEPTANYKGRKLESAYECERCGGRGVYFDYSHAVLGPYQPIGFSERLARQAQRDHENAKRTCEICKGRGVIYD